MRSHREVPGLADDAAWLRRLALRIAGARRADDLAQETLLVSLRCGPPRGSRRKWLAGILRNLERMHRRGSARRARRERVTARLTNGPSPLREVERSELRERLIAAVRALPEPCRAAVAGRFLDGRSCASLAREAGVPASTIRNRVRRGLLVVRARIEREYGGDPRALLLGPLLARPPRGRWRVPAAAAVLLCLFGLSMPASADSPEPREPTRVETQDDADPGHEEPLLEPDPAGEDVAL